MKVVGIDMGFARVGVAVLDTEVGIAFPREILAFDSYLLGLKNLVKEEGIERIIIGDPDGGREEDNHRNAIQKEKIRLEELFDIPVEGFDERYTSRIAEQSLFSVGKRTREVKQVSDSVSAGLILQGWYERMGKL